MDKLSNLVSLVYGAFLAIGGVMGYLKVHSKWSLIVGIATGLSVFLACKVGASNQKASYLYVASISLIMAMFFSMKFTASHVFMPAGLMLILSILTYVLVARGWLKS